MSDATHAPAAPAADHDNKRGWLDTAKGFLGRFLSGPTFKAFSTALDGVEILLHVKDFRERAAETAGKAVKRADKHGNFREFSQAMLGLTPEENEFIRELMAAITQQEQRERFQQQVALTGPTIADSTTLLKMIASIGDVNAALAYLGCTDYLEKPAPTWLDSLRDEADKAYESVKTTVGDLNTRATGANGRMDAYTTQTTADIRRGVSPSDMFGGRGTSRFMRIVNLFNPLR